MTMATVFGSFLLSIFLSLSLSLRSLALREIYGCTVSNSIEMSTCYDEEVRPSIHNPEKLKHANNQVSELGSMSFSSIKS